MKKLMAFLLAACVTLSCAACGASTPQQTDKTAPSQKQKIDFWMLPVIDESSLRSMVQEFNAQSKTTEVNLNVLDWSSGREQIKQAVASGSGPDVFYLGTGLDTAYINGKLLLPLDQNGYSQEDLGKYTANIKANMVDDHLYASPISYECYVLYYRTDVLKQFGFTQPPKTWDELKSMAKTITKGSNGKIMGFQFKGADDQLNAINYSWQTLMAQSGCNLMDLSAMKSTENTDKAKKALEYMKSFYTEGISKMGTSSNNGFREGKVAMFMFTAGPLTSEDFVSDPLMKDKWAIATLPKGPDNDGGYLGGHSVAVNAGTKHAENSVEFAKWLTSAKNVPMWLNKFYGVQPYDITKLAGDEANGIKKIYAAAPQIWDPLNKSAEASSPEFMIQSRNGYTARWDGQKRLIIAALTGEMPVDEALKQLDIEINQAL